MPTLRFLPVLGVAAILGVVELGGLHNGQMKARECGAQDQSPTDLSGRVERLLEQLDSDTRADRVSAERELTHMGPTILPLLPPPELLRSVAVRESVRRLRIKLEHVQARRTIQPSRFSLQGRFPLSTLLGELSDQTGNRFQLDGLPKETLQQPFDADFVDVPFWSVTEQISEKMRLEFRVRSSRVQVVPRAEAGPVPRRADVSPEAFELRLIKASLRPLFGNDRQRLLRVNCELLWEPRLRPLFLSFAATDIHARLDDGTSADPLNPRARYELPLGAASGNLHLQFDYVVPIATDVTVVSLDGRLMVETAAGEEQIKFPSLLEAAGVARRRGGVTVTVQRVMTEKSSREDGDSNATDVTVNIVVTYDTGGPAFESHRTWILHNRAFLQTATGESIAFDGPVNPVLQFDGGIAVEYTFRELVGSLDTYRFLYVAPTLIVDVDVDFELTNIPVLSPTDERNP